MKPQNLLTSIFLLPFVGIMGLLTGCGGGGGSSVNSGLSFTKWSDIDPPVTVTFTDGLSEDATYVAVGDTITNITDNGFSTSASAFITYRADMTISKIVLTTPNGTVAWDDTLADEHIGSTPWAGVIGAEDDAGSKVALLMDPLHATNDWDYQTFGAWETGRGTGSGAFGAISIGAPTAGSAIPTVDGATFEGRAVGAYVNADGDDFLTLSNLTVNASFADRELTFTTADTITIDPMTSVRADEPGLNLSGTLTYAPGVNSFTGTLNAPGRESKPGVWTVNPMSGRAQGRFYGPNAEELGGVFGVKVGEDSVESYGGAFGAIQTP